LKIKIPITDVHNTYLSLDHGRALRPKYSDRLENIHNAFVLHPLQHYAECDEDAGSANATAEMLTNTSINQKSHPRHQQNQITNK